MKRIDDAIIFAVKAHGGINRKKTTIPYILHPMEAAAIVAGMTDDRDTIIGALLHDVIEDTKTTAEQLEGLFGERVATLVAAVSENKRESEPPEETWLIRKQETVDALNSTEDLAVKMIVVGDKLSNIRAMYRDYLAVGDELWQRFNQKNPRMHAWYYRAVMQATTELKEHPAWQECNALVEKVFARYDQ